MKSHRLLLCAVLVLTPGVHAAEEEPFHVTASVFWNDRLVMKADVTIPRGAEAVNVTRGNLRLEMQAAATAIEPTQMIVRLLDISHEQPRVLHTSRSPDPPASARSLMYAICGDRITFRSPAPAQPEACAG